MTKFLRDTACLAMVLTPCAAQATDFSGLYVFGDSLVDSGNAYIATNGAVANPNDGYYRGRFSNGYNFADDLAKFLTKSVTQPALLGGTSAAVGGADAEFKTGESSPSFLSQIGLFTTLVAPTIPKDALVLVTFGGNDVRDTIDTPGAVAFSGASADLFTGLNLLYALGARNFVITGSPDVGLLPVSIASVGAGTATLAELTERSEDISALFAGDAARLDRLHGTDVTFFDLFAYEHALIADPAAFGLPATLDTVNPCQIIGGGSPQIANCANSLYFDEIHPTFPVHQAIARAIAGELGFTVSVPEPAAWAMLLLGCGVLGTALRLGRRRVQVAFAG